MFCHLAAVYLPLHLLSDLSKLWFPHFSRGPNEISDEKGLRGGGKLVIGLTRALLRWSLEGSPRVQVELKEAWRGAEEHNTTDPRFGCPGFKSQSCHLLAV